MNTPIPTIHSTSQDRLVACIASNPLLFWIPKVMGKNSEYVSYFAKHGFGLFVISAFFYFLPFRGLVFLGISLCFVYLGINAYRGQKVTIPYYTETLEKALIQLGIKSWFEGK